jgi:hypothetical protein
LFGLGFWPNHLWGWDCLFFLVLRVFLTKVSKEKEKIGDFDSQICVSLMFNCVFNGGDD